MSTEQRNCSVSKCRKGGADRELLAENLTFGEAYGMVTQMRTFMNTMVHGGLLSEGRRTYYFVGRP